MYNPNNKIIKKNIVENMVIIENLFIKYTRGISIVISISKIKKIILTKKKWILNGNRLSDKGSNPHSNGDDFSWFKLFFFEIKIHKINIIQEINKVINEIIMIINIIYIKFI